MLWRRNRGIIFNYPFKSRAESKNWIFRRTWLTCMSGVLKENLETIRSRRIQIKNGPSREKTCRQGFQPIKTQTSLLSKRDRDMLLKLGMQQDCSCILQHENTTGADQTVRMRRLVCAFDVRAQHSGFLSSSANLLYL